VVNREHTAEHGASRHENSLCDCCATRVSVYTNDRFRNPSMAIKLDIPDKVQTDTVQIRLTSSVDSILASLEPDTTWLEQMLDAPLSETLTLEVDCNPGDIVAEEFLQGLFIVSATKARNSNWRTFIEGWALPPGVSPRIAASIQRERRPNAPPFSVWELD
jgi:hypothetical protein